MPVSGQVITFSAAINGLIGRYAVAAMAPDGALQVATAWNATFDRHPIPTPTSANKTTSPPT